MDCWGAVGGYKTLLLLKFLTCLRGLASLKLGEVFRRQGPLRITENTAAGLHDGAQ